MSFGKMNTQIQITQKEVTLDDEGFQTESDVIVATVRAYREGRHGSEKWANRASFSEATTTLATVELVPLRNSRSCMQEMVWSDLWQRSALTESSFSPKLCRFLR